MEFRDTRNALQLSRVADRLDQFWRALSYDYEEMRDRARRKAERAAARSEDRESRKEDEGPWPHEEHLETLSLIAWGRETFRELASDVHNPNVPMARIFARADAVLLKLRSQSSASGRHLAPHVATLSVHRY